MTQFARFAGAVGIAAFAATLSGCCFVYPGGGKCEPMEYDGSCVDETTTRNCQDVTPVGYGQRAILRYAIMDGACENGNVCATTRWGTAICVARGAEKCVDLNETRCVDGRKQVCHWEAVMSPREPREYDYFWAETGEACQIPADAGHDGTMDMEHHDPGSDAGERDSGFEE